MGRVYTSLARLAGSLRPLHIAFNGRLRVPLRRFFCIVFYPLWKARLAELVESWSCVARFAARHATVDVAITGSDNGVSTVVTVLYVEDLAAIVSWCLNKQEGNTKATQRQQRSLPCSRESAECQDYFPWSRRHIFHHSCLPWKAVIVTGGKTICTYHTAQLDCVLYKRGTLYHPSWLHLQRMNFFFNLTTSIILNSIYLP